MMYLHCIFCSFLVLQHLLRAMAIMMATIATINTATRAPTAPRMPPRRGEGLLVGVTVVGPVTALEDTGALMVPPTVVVMVGITAGC